MVHHNQQSSPVDLVEKRPANTVNSPPPPPKIEITKVFDCVRPNLDLKGSPKKELINGNFSLINSMCIDVIINSKFPKAPSISIQFEGFSNIYNLVLELGNDKFWVKDCTSPVPSTKDRCFNSRNPTIPSNSSFNVLNGDGSIGTVDIFKMRIPKDVVTNVLFGVVRNANLTEFDGTIGINPTGKSFGFLGQLLERYPKLPSVVGFFLRDSFFHSTSSLTLGGYFSDITKGSPFFFDAPNPFNFTIKQVVIHNTKKEATIIIPASSVQLTLGDFSIEASPEDYASLLLGCKTLIDTSLQIDFEIGEGKVLTFDNENLFLKYDSVLASFCEGKTVRKNESLKRSHFTLGKHLYVRYMQIFFPTLATTGFVEIKR